MPLQSIANTIFPQALYQKHGSPEFYNVYEKIYKRIMKQRGQWGRYFHRMTSYTTIERYTDQSTSGYRRKITAILLTGT